MQQSEAALTEEVAKTINATKQAMARTDESGDEETVEDGLSRMKARLASERQRMADKIEQRRAELADAREAKKRERQAAEDAIMNKIRIDDPESAKLAPKEDARQQMAARLEQERVELQQRCDDGMPTTWIAMADAMLAVMMMMMMTTMMTKPQRWQ